MSPAPRAHLAFRGLGRRSRAVALLLHGGAETGTAPVSRWEGPPLRMLPFGWAIRRRDRTVAVARLRYRHRGWNGPAADPVVDVVDALATIAARRPGIPVVLVGHSMGGRAAIAAAGAPGVVGVVALAPWIPPTDPVHQLAGRAVVVVHGTDDHRTSPEVSSQFVARATGVAREARWVPIAAGDHAMLRRALRWHGVTAAAALAMVDTALGERLGPEGVRD